MVNELPTVSTPVEPLPLYCALAKAWVLTLGTTPSPSSLAVLMAQSALETGRWKSCKCWNLGNIKAPPTDTVHDYCYFTTVERLSLAQASTLIKQSNRSAPCALVKVEQDFLFVAFSPKHPACRFRAFATLAEGATDYLKFLQQKFKGAWDQVLTGDPASFVAALKARGYFTGDENAYRKSVVSLTAEYLEVVKQDSA